jgi:hypothetical protein
MNYDFGYIYREATITLKVTFLNEAIRVICVPRIVKLSFIEWK